MINFPRVLALLITTGFGCLANATEYWVSKSGSNSNSCLSPALSCQSIQKGLSLLKAGDTLNIDEGRYVEDSAASIYTSKCGLLDNNYGSLCVLSSGTLDAPITIRALPGKEGKVIIDSESKRAGIIIRKNDYIHIKNLTFVNSWTGGIANPGSGSSVPSDDSLSIGCVIEGNVILNTTGAYGVNNSAIYMWSTKDWTVRNNTIQYVKTEGGTHAHGLQSYGTINALVENNSISEVDNGVFWKDHYITDLVSRGHFQESVIRNNKISASVTGVLISIRGDGANPAGHNHIEGNIIELVKGTATGIGGYLAGAKGTSGDIVIKNNLIVGLASNNSGISIDSFESARIVGNVFAGLTSAISLRLINPAANKPAKLIESNYNVFDKAALIQTDTYSPQEKSFRVLSGWQALKPSQDPTIISLRQDNPDQNSIQITTQPIIDRASEHYKNVISPISGPNGSAYQPGPYQTQNQIIGSSTVLKSKPLPPKPL